MSDLTARPNDFAEELAALSKAIAKLDALPPHLVPRQDNWDGAARELCIFLEEAPDPLNWTAVRPLLEALYPGKAAAAIAQKVRVGTFGVGMALEALTKIQPESDPEKRLILCFVERLKRAVDICRATVSEETPEALQPAAQPQQRQAEEAPVEAAPDEQDSLAQSRKRGRASAPEPEEEEDAKPPPPKQERHVPSRSLSATPHPPPASPAAPTSKLAAPSRDDPRSAEEREFVRSFHPQLRETWFDASLTLPPPPDLPRSHDGLAIQDVPFTRQIRLFGRSPINDLPGNSQLTVQRNVQALYYNLALGRQLPPGAFGEPFLVSDSRGLEGLDDIKASAGSRGMSTFFSHGPHDWRYSGISLEHKRFQVFSSDFEEMTPERRNLWEECLSIEGQRVEHKLPKAAEEAASYVDWVLSNPDFVFTFAIFKVVGYDTVRIPDSE
ncbi:hypothetical protein JCM10207_007188 [Rhodosporidiobolus poonsookiae]